jgi:hypothetical protein
MYDHFTMKNNSKFKASQGESTLSPPKIVVTCVIFLQSMFWVTYGHHIVNYFYLFKAYSILFIRKLFKY